MKFEIKARISGNVLFAAEIPDDSEPRLRVRAKLELAVKARANLVGAYLVDANLAGANLDTVREIILDDSRRLDMGHWHADESKWQEHTCAEEAVCGTTHCLAGWLQVCATDEKVRAMTASVAGFIQAPIAAPLFHSTDRQVLRWLKDREYARAASVESA